VIKPSSGSGSKDVFVVQNQSELVNILAYLGNSNNYILQEYIGTGEEEYTVGILCTPKTGYVKHIILKRDLSLSLSIKQSVVNNTGNTSLGDRLVISTGISQGTFVTHPLIDIVVHKIVEFLKPISTINMQCRVHEGEVYIFEINPRFSGTTNLRAIVGFNEPEYIINEKLSIDNSELLEKDWKNQKVLRGIKEYLIK
jgi:carbamoyl-phosphate synthase large subunit